MTQRRIVVGSPLMDIIQGKILPPGHQQNSSDIFDVKDAAKREPEAVATPY